VQESTGLAARKGRAYRELFQLVRDHVMASHGASRNAAAEAQDGDDDEDNA
jgi:ribosome-associated protein